MSSVEFQRVSFDDPDARREQMHSTVDTWLEELLDLTDEARASEQFQRWLDVQGRFHDYSHRNTLLIHQQCPGATKVAGYRTWQREFDRHVKEGESAIWIWAPIVTTRCPECENSPSYHEDSDCEYDETPPEEWSEGLVGFKPTPVFDVSQTEGEPLPELETGARGDATDLRPAVLAAADSLGIDARVVPASEWSHGEANGVCRYDSPTSRGPVVEVKDRGRDAAVVGTLAHEYAHALLHADELDEEECTKREVEAEAVAYVVGRHFGLDTSNSAFYLAAWADDDVDTVTDRLGRISSTAGDIVAAVESQLDASP